jgi:hypothetical protein
MIGWALSRWSLAALSTFRPRSVATGIRPIRMDGEQRMRVDGIAAGDIVMAPVGGQMAYGEVLEIGR